MQRNEWNKLLDNYLQTNTMLADDYEELNDTQKLIIQELKKAFKRVKEDEKFCNI